MQFGLLLWTPQRRTSCTRNLGSRDLDFTSFKLNVKTKPGKSTWK